MMQKQNYSGFKFNKLLWGRVEIVEIGCQAQRHINFHLLTPSETCKIRPGIFVGDAAHLLHFLVHPLYRTQPDPHLASLLSFYYAAFFFFFWLKTFFWRMTFLLVIFKHWWMLRHTACNYFFLQSSFIMLQLNTFLNSILEIILCSLDCTHLVSILWQFMNNTS